MLEDTGAQPGQIAGEIRVAPLDVVCPMYGGLSLRLQGRDDQRRPAPQVGGKHVCPVEPLHAADVFAADLRGGAALVIAALQAEGCSAVHQCRHIQRGYADLAGDLAGLGARVRQNTE